MRFRTTLKTLIRSPLKSAITLLLLTATTFAFVSRGVEYVATVQQIHAAEKSYFATGTAERTVAAYEDEMYNRLGDAVYEIEKGNYTARTSRAVLPMEQEVADAILSSKYIEKSESRLVSGGTHPECWSVLEQPLSDLKNFSASRGSDSVGTFAMYDSLFIVENGMDRGDGYMEDLMRETLVAYPDTMHISIYQTGSALSGDSKAQISDHCFSYEVGKVGRENSANASFWDLFSGSLQDGDMIICAGRGKANVRTILPCIDYPLINLSRIEREYGETDIETILRDPAKYGCMQYIVSDESAWINMVGTDLRNSLPLPRDNQKQISAIDYFATVNRNFHTSEVVYTSDMNLIHKFKSGAMFIQDGRALEENEQAEVCVIGADFAELNSLGVGDTITLDLCADTMVHSGKVFGRETPYPTDRDVVSENQLTKRGLPNVEKSFEIVGIWSDADFDVEDPYTYALNTIFVPESCYPWPGQVEPSLLPSTFSFELKHPGDAALIKAEIGDKLAALGYELKINDGGYAAAKPNLEFMRLSALIGFVAMCVGLALCLILITYLFIIRKKKDYAIMRALGTTKFRSNKALLSALLVLSLCSVTIGGTAGGVVAQNTAVQVAAEVSEVTGVVAEVANSWTLVSAFAFGTLVLVLVFAIFGLVKISRAPPLALLQGR